MEQASLQKRIHCGIADYCFLFLPLYFFGGLLTALPPWKETLSQQASPFIIMIFLMCPLYVGVELVKGSSYSEFLEYWPLFTILFFAEATCYFLSEVLPPSWTIGRWYSKTELRTINDDQPRVFAIIVRSLLKTVSRYLYGIPLPTMLFSEQRQTWYDQATKTVVVKKNYMESGLVTSKLLIVSVVVVVLLVVRMFAA